MHELSVAGALLRQVEGEARAREAVRVRRVKLRLGELSGVDPRLLATAYAAARGGTVCDSAELEIEEVPAVWSCPDCAVRIEPAGALRCTRCERPAVLGSGDELLLERIDMEVPDV